MKPITQRLHFFFFFFKGRLFNTCWHEAAWCVRESRTHCGPFMQAPFSAMLKLIQMLLIQSWFDLEELTCEFGFHWQVSKFCLSQFDVIQVKYQLYCEIHVSTLRFPRKTSSYHVNFFMFCIFTSGIGMRSVEFSPHALGCAFSPPAPPQKKEPQNEDFKIKCQTSCVFSGRGSWDFFSWVYW